MSGCPHFCGAKEGPRTKSRGEPHWLQSWPKHTPPITLPAVTWSKVRGPRAMVPPRKAPQGEVSEIGSRCSFGRGVQALCSVLGLRLPPVLRRGGPQGSLTDSGSPCSLQKVGEDEDVQGQCGVGTNLKGCGPQPATHQPVCPGTDKSCRLGPILE